MLRREKKNLKYFKNIVKQNNLFDIYRISQT